MEWKINDLLWSFENSIRKRQRLFRKREKVKEIKFLSDSIKIEFENELSYEERDSEDGKIKTSFDIEKLGLKGKEMDRMLFESKYIMNAISNIKKQILGQVEIK